MGNMKIKYSGAMVSGKDDGYYPNLQVSGKAIPELKDKRVGSTCKIVITGKIKSMVDDSDSWLSVNLEVIDGEYYKEDEEDNEVNNEDNNEGE